MNPNQNARQQTQMLRTIVAETRDDVRRLKHALQAVLHHMAGDQSGHADGNQPSHQRHPGDRRDGTVEAAGGNAEQEIDDAAFRHALDYGLPAPLEVYRRAYATVGLPWPGDERARRLHPISDDGPQAPTCPSVWQLSWQGTEGKGRPPASRTDTHQPTSDRRGDDERPAAQRLADALGWDHVPQLSEAEQKESDLDLQAAQVQARRLYQQETGEFERGWDAALQLAVDVVTGACDGDQAQQWLQRVLHAHTGPDNEPPHQQQPVPIRPAEQLVQPGMFDSEEELEGFLTHHRRERKLGPTPVRVAGGGGEQHQW